MSRIIDAKPEDNDDEYTVKVNLSSHDKRGRNTVTGYAVEPVPLGKTSVHCCHYNNQCAEGDGSDDATDVWQKAFKDDLDTAQKDSDNDDPWKCDGESCQSRIDKSGFTACVIPAAGMNDVNGVTYSTIEVDADGNFCDLTKNTKTESVVLDGDGNICDYSSNMKTETPFYAN